MAQMTELENESYMPIETGFAVNNKDGSTAVAVLTPMPNVSPLVGGNAHVFLAHINQVH